MAPKAGPIGKERMLIARTAVNRISQINLSKKKPFSCTASIESKTKRSRFNEPTSITTQLLEHIHKIMPGKISKKSVDGVPCFVAFLDNCTGMSAVYFI